MYFTRGHYHAAQPADLRVDKNPTDSYRSWTTRKSTIFNCQYLPNRSTLDIGVLGYIGIVLHKEHPPEVWSVPPVTPRILWVQIFCNMDYLVFKLSPCSKCNLFVFGQFPDVWFLIADVSELTVGSIFIGRWMKYVYVSGWIVWSIYTWLSWSGEVADPIGISVHVPGG